MKEYILGRKIATGGMAEVFLAHNREKKTVVVKKILPHLVSQPEYLRMFREELNILSSLQHNNIVRVLETHSNYVVMEYLEGYDWRIISQHPIPQPIVIYLFLEALSALSYVHDLRIIHRDISPQNWMLTYGGQVKLLDFGISKYEERSHETVTGVLKGKYSYMSPEQALGGKASIHSDIFAMGIILFEFCTQTRLFKRANDLLTLQAISQCQVEIPNQIEPPLKSILKKALARRKEDRYQSCEAFRKALLHCHAATKQEVLEFIRALPRPRNQLLFEVTQMRHPKNNLMGAGILAICLAVLGLGW